MLHLFFGVAGLRYDFLAYAIAQRVTLIIGDKKLSYFTSLDFGICDRLATRSVIVSYLTHY